MDTMEWMKQSNRLCELLPAHLLSADCALLSVSCPTSECLRCPIYLAVSAPIIRHHGHARSMSFTSKRLIRFYPEEIRRALKCNPRSGRAAAGSRGALRPVLRCVLRCAETKRVAQSPVRGHGSCTVQL